MVSKTGTRRAINPTREPGIYASWRVNPRFRVRAPGGSQPRAGKVLGETRTGNGVGSFRAVQLLRSDGNGRNYKTARAATRAVLLLAGAREAVGVGLGNVGV